MRMKKLLTFLTLLTLSIGVTWAGEVTFTAGVDKSSTTSITKDGVTISVTSGTFNRDDNYRLYANQTMTIRSSNTISKIVIVCSDISYGPEFLLLNENSAGNLINDSDVTATWTGSSTSVSLNASSQVRMNSIVVTYEGNSGGGDDPTPTNGVKYERVNSLSSGDVGKEFILVNQDGSGVLGAISTTSTKYGTVVPNTDFTYNVTDHTITVPFDNTSIKVLTLGGESNAWTFDMGNSSYLYWSSGNSLNTTSTLSDNSKWSVSFNDGIASISNNKDPNRVIRFNSDRFACYTTNTGSLPCLYRKVESIAETYNVNVNQPAVGGTIATEGNITEAAEGSIVTLIATPETHYQFTSWNVHKTGDATTTVTVTENQFTMPGYDVTVEATFTAMVAHSITVSDNTGTASPTTAYEGETVTLTPNFPEGQVVDWDNTTITPQTVTINHSDYTFTMPDADVTVKFAFIVAPNESVATYIFDTAEGLAAIGITAPTSQGVDLSDENSYNSDDVSMTTTHGSTNTRIWYNSSTGLDLRVYGPNDTKPAGTLTFAVPNGYTITKIVFNYGDRIGGFTVNTGDITNDNITWTGSAQSVTFTAKDQTRIKTINVTYIPGETPDVVEYYLTGNFDSWNGKTSTYKFNPQQDGTYKLETVLPDIVDDSEYYINDQPNQEYVRFKISKVVNNGNPILYGGDGGNDDYGLHSGHHTGIETGTNDSHQKAFRLPDCFNAIFTLDPSTMKFDVEKPQLYMIGTFNSYQLPDNNSLNDAIEMTPDTENGGWTSTTQLSAGAEFRLYDAWHVHHGGNGYYIYQNEHESFGETRPSDLGLELNINNNNQSIFHMVDAGNYIITVNSTLTKLVADLVPVYYTATIASGITGGSVSFNADSQVSNLNNLTAGYTVNVFVASQSSDWELKELYYTIEGSTEKFDITATDTDGQYSFQMPAGNVTINAKFDYIGTATLTTYERLTNLDDVKIGEKYIIVNEDYSVALSGTSNGKTSIIIDNCQTTISSDSGIAEFVICSSENANYPYLLKHGDDLYLSAYSSGTSLGQSTSPTCSWTIDLENDGHTKILSEYNRLVYYFASTGGAFTAYSANNWTSNVYLYKVATPPTEATLAQICAVGEVGKYYTISNEDGLLGVYKLNKSIWFKDENGEANDLQVPNASDLDYAIVQRFPDNTSTTTYQKNFDQSNWIEVVFPEDVDYTKSYVKNLTGRLESKANPKLILTVDVEQEDIVYTIPASAQGYVPNPYTCANFKGSQPGTIQGETNNYFFSKPKVQEYAQILWAVWDGTKFNMPTENNAYGFTGSFKINGSLNATSLDGLQNGEPYDFTAIIRKEAPEGSKAAGDYVVYPLDLKADVPTAIDNIFNINGTVKSVKYVNVAGMVSDVPFQGVNIVVTEYTDGSRTTSKMLRK